MYFNNSAILDTRFIYPYIAATSDVVDQKFSRKKEGPDADGGDDEEDKPEVEHGKW